MKTTILALCLALAPTMLPAAAPPPVPADKEKAKIKLTEAGFMGLASALAMYKLNAGEYPTAKQGLKALVEKPVIAPIPRRWLQMVKEIPKDPWGREYRYLTREKDGKTVHILASDGADASSPAVDLEMELGKPLDS